MHPHLCWNKTFMWEYPRCKLASVILTNVISFLYNFWFCLSKIGLNTDSATSFPSPESTTFLIWFTAAFAPHKPRSYPQWIPQYLYFLWEMRNCPATRSRNKKTCYVKAMICLINSPKQNLLNKRKKITYCVTQCLYNYFWDYWMKGTSPTNISSYFLILPFISTFLPFLFCFCIFVVFFIVTLGCW